MFALWHKRPHPIPHLGACRHLWLKRKKWRGALESFGFDAIYLKLSALKVLEMKKAHTLKSSRETVSCSATLLLFVSLLGIRNINRLTGRHVCQGMSRNNN